MSSEIVRCMMATTVLFLSARPALGAQPPCAETVNHWWHNLRHDWDGDGTPENKFVECAFFDAKTGYHYGPIFDPPGGFCVCPCNHKTGAGNPYDHWHFNHYFPMIGRIDGVWRTVTATMHEAFYDWYYSGYTKVGTYSVSQNCYGYAFGTGTFVDDGTYGAETILSDDWEDAGEDEMQVAYHWGHAIKVTPKECTDEQASWYIISKSSEKCRSSAVYEKTTDCPDGVTLKGGPYDYYKKKDP